MVELNAGLVSHHPVSTSVYKSSPMVIPDVPLVPHPDVPLVPLSPDVPDVTP